MKERNSTAAISVKAPVIGLPRAMLYDRYEVLWKSFFSALGMKGIVSKPTNKAMIEAGSALAIDEACLSTKIYLGHIQSLIGKCDYILVPRISNFGLHRNMCTKFESLYDVVCNVFRNTDQKFVACKNKKVMVIGGGDTGNDCVGTAIRLGASSVVQLEMMPKAPDQRAANNPWPEWPRVCKTDYGQQEAIALWGHDPRVYQTTVKEFVKDKNGNLCKVVLVKLESKKDEKTGRMMMAEVSGSEYTVNAELVLIAAGFLGSEDYVTKAFGVEVNERTNVKTAPGEYKTNVPNIFTAGDMHRGQSLVVWAIREGREAAQQIDLDLMGYTNLSVQ